MWRHTFQGNAVIRKIPFLGTWIVYKCPKVDEILVGFMGQNFPAKGESNLGVIIQAAILSSSVPTLNLWSQLAEQQLIAGPCPCGPPWEAFYWRFEDKYFCTVTTLQEKEAKSASVQTVPWRRTLCWFPITSDTSLFLLPWLDGSSPFLQGQAFILNYSKLIQPYTSVWLQNFCSTITRWKIHTQKCPNVCTLALSKAYFYSNLNSQHTTQSATSVKQPQPCNHYLGVELFH